MNDKSGDCIFDIAHGLKIALEKMIGKCPNCSGKGEVVILGESYGECPECWEARIAVEKSKWWVERYMNGE